MTEPSTRPRSPVLALVLAASLGLGACEAQDPDGAAASAPAATPSASGAAAGGEAVAVVNGRPIPKALLEAYAEQRRGPDGKPLPQARLLDELIAQEILVQEAQRKGLAQRPDVRMRLELQRRNLLAMMALRERMAAKPVTDEELRRIYEEQIASQKRREFKARHILVKEERKARELIARLDKGADFAELAREHSEGPSGKQGGELGWFSPGQMVKPFSDAVAALEKGQYTKEPVQTRFGWHVVQLQDVRELPAPSFEQVRDRLREIVERRRVQEFLKELLEEAKIEKRPATGPAPKE